MKDNKTIDRFKSKLKVEAALNSAIAGIGVGVCVGGLIALICWLSGYKYGIWVALGLGVAAALIAFPLFYFLKFRPTAIQTSRRVDALGLEQRAVTMHDYADDNSKMAVRQRIDAQNRVASLGLTALKLSVPVWVTIALIVAIVFATPFGVVSGLYYADELKSPSEGSDPYANFIAVDYLVEEGGEIEGNANQLLENPGDNAETVTAVAIEGYIFMGWDDGIKSPTRTDRNIRENLVVTALFEPLPDGDVDADGDFDGPGNQGDIADDQPSPGEVNGQDGEGDGQGNPGDGEGKGNGEQDKGEGKGDGQGEGAGGKWSEKNQIINGETYYRDWLDQYYADAMQELTSLEDLPPEVREFIEAYYGSV